jgi:phytanoyl-CoA hydroxylase
MRRLSCLLGHLNEERSEDQRLIRLEESGLRHRNSEITIGLSQVSGITQTNNTEQNAHHQIQSSVGEVKYVLENSILSKEHIHFYSENGFLVVPSLVPEDDINRYHQHFTDICNGTLPPSPYLTIMRDIQLVRETQHQPTRPTGEHTVTKFQDFQFDEIFFQYCLHPQILPYVQAFLGPNVRAMHTMLINKPPDLGSGTSRHPLHQDLYYFPFRPAERVVCSWTAMQEITKENGCLIVLPGSHQFPLLPHAYPKWEGGVNKAYHGVDTTTLPQEKLFHVEMKKGDTIFFHPLLIHGSGLNRSKGFRKAISCHYASSDCYFIDCNNTIQESIAHEAEEMAKKKLGFDVEFMELWKKKSRIVSGNNGIEFT